MRNLSLATMLVYAAGSIGTGAFYGFNNFVLPLILNTFNAPALVIGLLSSTRSIEGVLIQPTVGAWSDRVWTRFGRRRPFILVGIPLSSAFVVAGAFAHGLLPLAIVIFLFSIFFNVAVDPYTALLADIAPVTQRGRLSGLATSVQLLSSVALLLVLYVGTAGASGVPLWGYALVAAALIGGFGMTVVGIHEMRDLIPKAASDTGRLPLRVYVNALLEQRQAMRYLGALFIYQFGLNAIVPFLGLFIVEEIHASQQVAIGLSAGLLVITAIAAVVAGKVADSFGARQVLAVGWAVLTASAIAGVVITTLPQTIGVVILAGIGNGAATAVTWPLLTALIPPEQTGVFAGLKAAAESVAIPLSVVVAAEIFLPRFGYHGIFAMLALCISAAVVLLVRFVHVTPIYSSS